MIEYNIERMASHGVRRADEMDQVTETLRELGIDPLMASATSTRQREMGQIGKEPAVRKTLKEGRAAMLEAISAAAKTGLKYPPAVRMAASGGVHICGA